MRIYTFILNIFLVLTASKSYGAAGSAFAQEPEIEHTTHAFSIEEYDRVKGESEAAGEKGIPYSGHYMLPVLCPDASTSRVFIKRSFETYATECATDSRPTRLIIGCGHCRSNDGMNDSCSHSSDHFTINICKEVQPDILGDALRVEAQAFMPNSWDFILFEHCFVLHSFSDKQLSMIANSLRPNGAWVIDFDLHFLPHNIRIADKSFEGGASLTDCSDHKDLMTQTIFTKAGKMVDEDTVSFTDHADVQTIVNSYFIAHGFKSAEIRTLPIFFTPEMSPVSFLTGEIVDLSRDAPIYGEGINVLAGAELLSIMNTPKNMHEFAIVVRK